MAEFLAPAQPRVKNLDIRAKLIHYSLRAEGGGGGKHPLRPSVIVNNNKLGTRSCDANELVAFRVD